MPDVISGVIIALVTYVTIVSRWQSYEKIPNLQRNSGKSLQKTTKFRQKCIKSYNLLILTGYFCIYQQRSLKRKFVFL